MQRFKCTKTITMEIMVDANSEEEAKETAQASNEWSFTEWTMTREGVVTEPEISVVKQFDYVD